MPLILADVDLIDAQIITLDRLPDELDARRIRRARRQVLSRASGPGQPHRFRRGGVMGRRFKNLETPEQQYAAQQAQRGTAFSPVLRFAPGPRGGQCGIGAG